MLRQALHEAEEGEKLLLQRRQQQDGSDDDDADDDDGRVAQHDDGGRGQPEPQRQQKQQQQQQQAQRLKQQQQRTLRGGTNVNYGSVATTGPDEEEDNPDEDPDQEEDDDEEEDDDDDDEETEEDDDEETEEEELDDAPPPHVKLWNGIKNLVRIVANVDNLYDDPSFHPGAASGRQQSWQQTQQQQLQYQPPLPHLQSSQATAAARRTRNLIVLFWFFVLASSYATERSTFKLLVDRAGPFRLFAVETITAAHALWLGSGLAVARFVRRRRQRTAGSSGNAPFSSSSRSTARDVSLGISIVDVALMALLETLQLLLVFLTGLHVPPTLTVILIQFTLPLTAFLTQFVHPEGRCSCTATTTATPFYDGGTDLPPSDEEFDDRRVYDGHPRAPPPRHPGGPPDPYRGGEDRYPHYPPQDYYHHQHPRDTSQSPPGAPPQSSPAASSWMDRRGGQPLPRCGGLSAEHVGGSLLILLAVALALVPAFYAIGHPDFFVYADTIPIRTAYNTLLYVSSCIPAAAAQLYKEHVFLQSKQPVNAVQLNLLLSIFEFLFASILAPLVFELQGLGARGDWAQLYPSSKFGENFADGVRCFFRALPDEDQESKYYDDARCDFALGLAIFHAASVVAVGTAADKLVNAGATKVLYRGLSAGIVVAVLCMHAYDMHIVEFSYGPAIDGLNLACLIILILGSEVYHRVALQDLTFDTVYQPVVIDAAYE